MTRAKIAGLGAAAFLLATASAFAQDAAAPQQPAAPATPTLTKPALTHAQRVALEKSCKNEWTADRKAGKAKDITRKAFIADCMKKGA